MSEFINTIEALGDDATVAAIIERTITEFKDDVLTRIGTVAFRGCTALTYINLPRVITIDQSAFQDCTSLTAVDLPSLEELNYGSFYTCSSLASVDFPNLKKISGNDTFRGCSSLMSVSFPYLTSSGYDLFTDCKSLVSVNLPSMTSLNNQAFRNCKVLSKLDFPKVRSVGNNAFAGCSALNILILRSETACSLSNTSAFTGTPITSGTGYIYVPAALVDGYKAATNWSTYADQIRVLEDYTVDGTITGELDETKI